MFSIFLSYNHFFSIIFGNIKPIVFPKDVLIFHVIISYFLVFFPSKYDFYDVWKILKGERSS